MGKLITFVSSVRTELEKVTWPTRKETISTAAVVIAIVFLISLYLWLCDVAIVALLKKVLGS